MVRDRDSTESRFCTLHCRISRSSVGILLSTEPFFTLTLQNWLSQLKTNVKVGGSFPSTIAGTRGVCVCGGGGGVHKIVILHCDFGAKGKCYYCRAN